MSSSPCAGSPTSRRSTTSFSASSSSQQTLNIQIRSPLAPQLRSALAPPSGGGRKRLLHPPMKHPGNPAAAHHGADRPPPREMSKKQPRLLPATQMRRLLASLPAEGQLICNWRTKMLDDRKDQNKVSRWKGYGESDTSLDSRKGMGLAKNGYYHEADNKKLCRMV